MNATVPDPDTSYLLPDATHLPLICHSPVIPLICHSPHPPLICHSFTLCHSSATLPVMSPHRHSSATLSPHLPLICHSFTHLPLICLSSATQLLPVRRLWAVRAAGPRAHPREQSQQRHAVLRGPRNHYTSNCRFVRGFHGGHMSLYVYAGHSLCVCWSLILLPCSPNYKLVPISVAFRSEKHASGQGASGQGAECR